MTLSRNTPPRLNCRILLRFPKMLEFFSRDISPSQRHRARTDKYIVVPFQGLDMGPSDS